MPLDVPKTDTPPPDRCSPVPKDIQAANPIYPLRGIKREVVDTGAQLGALSLKLTYDTTTLLPVSSGIASQFEAGVLGDGWSSGLHRKVIKQGAGKIALVVRGDGYKVIFKGNGAGIFTPQSDHSDRLFSAAAGGYSYLDSQGQARESYDAEGKLTAIQWARGGSVALTYSDASTSTQIAPGEGYLIRAQDDRGRSLTFQYSATGRLTQIRDTANQLINLSYNAKSMLSGITWPDESSRSYLYENTSYPWALTGIEDERGVRYASFGYDSAGRAISSEHAGGVNQYSTSYDSPPTKIVTEGYDSELDAIVRTSEWQAPSGVSMSGPRGHRTGMGASVIQGKPYLTTQSQPAGSGCAASTSSQGYDANGNVERRDDFNGTRTCYANDLGRNLETTRVEGLAFSTSCATVTANNGALPTGSRKISTQWHPDWHVRIKQAEPGRFTTWVYNGKPDPFSSNTTASCAPSTALLPDGKPIAVLCSLVEQATTDTDGHLGFRATMQSGVANRVNTWTYNERGQVLTANGARTDVNDITTYAYFSDATADHTVGDLQSITDALGNVTQFAKYNQHGQVLQMADANGVVSSYTYDSRQRLESMSIAGQTTTYTYDAVGQLTKVTLPNGSFIGYDYDDAHRLVAIQDNLGNRVDYTLDNAGNRVAENFKDSSGVLRRQLTRVIDALGRIEKTTGRE